MPPLQFLQLRIYALLVQQSLGVVPSELRLLYLGSGDVLTAPCDAETVKQAEEEVARTWDAIVTTYNQGTFEPCTGPLCNWCFHKSSCPAFAGQPSDPE